MTEALRAANGEEDIAQHAYAFAVPDYLQVTAIIWDKLALPTARGFAPLAARGWPVVVFPKGSR